MELLAVVHRVHIGGEILAALELAHGGLALQDDHDADHVGVRMELLILILNDRTGAEQVGADVVQLLKGDAAGGSLNAGNAQTQDHDHGQSQGQSSSKDILHLLPPAQASKKKR